MTGKITLSELAYDNKIEYKTINSKNMEAISHTFNLSEDVKDDINLVSKIYNFKTNNYVVNELINWENIPKDPIFMINFPNRKMLLPKHLNLLKQLLQPGESIDVEKKVIKRIHNELNPQPGGQLDYNVPMLNNERLNGIQHKYRETILVFPKEGQTCHAFCTYCFRWPQFTNELDLRISLDDPEKLVEYVQKHEEIQDILFTGGDPMKMSYRNFSKYIYPLLEAEIKHLKTIRIGSKSLSYWPYRFITDSDSDLLLELFNEITNSDINLSFIANFNHPNELKTTALKIAVKNILNTGAVIRTQSPIIRNVNDNSEIWKQLWREQVNLGMIPYYMFIIRNTGSKHYFEVPLVKATRIYQNAIRSLSGLCRSAKGPIMSSTPGKIEIIGITSMYNKRFIVLRFVQARNPKWVGRPFFAKYNPNANWIDDLEPAVSKKFFFEHTLSKYLVPYGNPHRSRTLNTENIQERAQLED